MADQRTSVFSTVGGKVDVEVELGTLGAGSRGTQGGIGIERTVGQALGAVQVAGDCSRVGEASCGGEMMRRSLPGTPGIACMVKGEVVARSRGGPVNPLYSENRLG